MDILQGIGLYFVTPTIIIGATGYILKLIITQISNKNFEGFKNKLLLENQNAKFL